MSPTAPPDGSTPPPDLGDLIEQERLPAGRAELAEPLIEHSQRVLVWEHLASWLVAYHLRLAEIGGEPYRSWSKLVQAAVEQGLAEGTPGGLPSHLAIDQSPPGPEDLVDYLLAPVRSGLVLTRADLSRAAVDLGLGMRMGERSFALQSLLNQDRGAVLGWMAGEASRQIRRLRSSFAPQRLRGWWVDRARSSASLLEGYATAAG